jgi:DNA-binding winged helix-turn-helix (wHTH) protein/tetratricopeptide (TPR) repeat protein/TolB-like protein
MATAGSTPDRFVQFGPFVVDLNSGEVKKDGQVVRITEQPTRVLLTLLERPGEIVSREELRVRLWSNDTNVDFDHSIHAAINKLRQALGDSPEQPRFVETVPRRGYRLIALPAAAPAFPPEPIPFGATKWQQPALVAAGALLLVLCVLIAVLLHFKLKPRPQAAAVPQSSLSPSLPRRIAIIGLRNLSNRKECDWLSTAFSEMLATELGTSGDLQPVSGEDVAQMKRELAISDAGSYGQPTLHEIRENLGTDLVLVGSFMPIGVGKPSDRVRFDLRLLNTATGQTEASLSETGTVSDLFDLISDAGLRLRLQLGVTALSSSEQAEIRHAMAGGTGTQGLYFSGLEKIRNFDYDGAREILTKAVAADPKNSLAHEALSVAYGGSGYETLAAREAQSAFDLANGLSYEQGLRVEGRYYETKHEWVRAEQAYQRLCGLSPGAVDAAVHLARVQAFDGKPNDAMATLGHLRAFPRTSRDEAEIDQAEASVQQQAGDATKELAAAKAAAAQGEQAHAPILIARALRTQGVALSYLGNSTQALSDEHQAERIFETMHDPGGLADALIDDGDILSDLGDMSAAETAWRKALAIAQSTGNKLKEAVISNNLGNALLIRGEPEQARILYLRSYNLSVELDDKTGQASSLLTTGDALQGEGRLNEAKKSYEQSLQLATRIENHEVRAEALEALAGDLADLGDSVQARKIAQQAVTAARDSGDKSTEVAALVYLSQTLAARGDLAGAQATAQKAAVSADTLGDKTLQSGSHRVLACILALQGDAAKAHANYEQALALAETVKDSTEEREIRYALAELAIEEQRPADAKQMLQLLQLEANRTPNVDAELECLILQTELELSDKQNDAALRSALRAQSVSGRDDRLELKISAARVLVKTAAASRRWMQAEQVVKSALLQASQSGCIACELKAEVSQCELKADENASDASLCFTNLQRTAESKGFRRIAQNAASRFRSPRI